jgi:tight adherence protein B
VLVVCLAAGAVVVGWPGGAVARRRLRTPEVGSSGGGVRVGVLVGLLGEAVERRPRRVLLYAIAVACALGVAVGGTVAGVVAAVYAWLLGRALIRRDAARRAALARAEALDELAALAADLRAGLPPAAARSFHSGASIPGSSAGSAVGRIAQLTASVWQLAEETGAPAADLVERIEADARAADRAAASAAAQAAGAQATAMLLAALPLGGIGLGLAIGADPVHVLLRTPLGAGCAVVAVLLQAGGLLWADRLALAGVAR